VPTWMVVLTRSLTATGGEIEKGVVVGADGDAGRVAAELINAIARHRAWRREAKGQQVPA
jgi:hypothetical protein